MMRIRNAIGLSLAAAALVGGILAVLLGALAAAEVISHYGARPEKPLKELAAAAGLI